MDHTDESLHGQEMIKMVLFILLSIGIIGPTMSALNLSFYSQYKQTKSDAQIYSLTLPCFVEKIIAREINEKNRPSWTMIESRFLISIQHPLNSTKKYFEEKSIPLSTYNSVVSLMFHSSMGFDSIFVSRSTIPILVLSILTTLNEFH